MTMIWVFDGTETKRDVYRGEDCIKKFRESSKKHTMKTINSEKKKMIPLTSKEYESYLNKVNCHICKKKFEDKYTTDKNHHKITDYCHYAGVQTVYET